MFAWKKWILSPLSMCTTSFRKGGVADLHAWGNTKKGEWYPFSNYAGMKSGLRNQMKPLFPFNSFFNDIQLTEPFLEFFI